MKETSYKKGFYFFQALNAGLMLWFLLGGGEIEKYTFAIIISSLFFLIASFLLFKISLPAKEVLILVVLFFAIKSLFIFQTPVGSDDYYRYLWDGKISVNGINPFKYTPEDENLKRFSTEQLPQKVSYPTMKSIYFPVAQWIFAAGYLVSGENITGIKIILLLSEVLILICLYLLLLKRKADIKNILIYSALPLIAFQFFTDAHIDLAGAALLLASVTLYFYNKKIFGYILLGLSISVKPVGFLLIPLYFFDSKGMREKLLALFVPGLVFAATFIPYIFTGTPLDTLLNFSAKWTFNGAIYNTLKLVIESNMIVRILCGVLFILVYTFILFSKKELIIKVFLSILFLILFSPVTHQWYLIWFIIFLPLVKSFSGIYIAAAVSVSFFTVLNYLNGGGWVEFKIVLLIEYLPLVFLLYYDLFIQKENKPVLA